MIQNKKQYKITKAQAKKFESALSLLEEQNENTVKNDLLFEVEKNALRSQLEDLKAEIEIYEEHGDIIKVSWFNNFTTKPKPYTIGIIIKKDPITKENFLYIGIGSGRNLKHDIGTILKWGSKIPLEAMIEIVKVESEK